MPRAVLDTTILVSAFLRPVGGGAAFDLLVLAQQENFELALSSDILAETRDVLLTRPHLRRRYIYPDAAVIAFTDNLAQVAVMAAALPAVSVVRDPADDMIIATALATSADFLVTRDKDLLDLGTHAGIAILSPEDFLALLRQQPIP
jgi:putative PIN family toxin of toxin-antitoxin system